MTIRPLFLSLALALGAGTLPATAAEERPDRLIADFEGADYGGWTATGTAFGSGPAKGTLPNQMSVGGYAGNGLVNSYLGGDVSEGTLTSPEFPIERRRINLLIGGGRQPETLSVNLLVGGKVVRSATGIDSEFLAPVSWDVAEFAGKSAKIEIVDRANGGWGHLNVDQIVQSDTEPKVPPERETLLARAEASDAAAAARAAADPNRPTMHVLAPANWINDPNGLLYYKGYYHVFYQHNPYGDDWGNMHWGHVRSKDLAHWERLPIALWPSKTKGEDHVFSGSAIVRKDGTPMIFYTSIGPRFPEQWAALPETDDLVVWQKHPANPVVANAVHGDTKVHEWRDPYVIHDGDTTWMVCGGNTNGNQGGEGSVFLYEAQDDSLTKWTYRGILFRHPDAGVKNVECPIFFPLDGRWVLITSQGKPVDWFVGDFDRKAGTFTATARGHVDEGQVYAPSVLAKDPKGRAILWGWLDGVPGGRGWRHCLTVPRVLSIGPDGRLRQQPAAELQSLRGPAKTAAAVPLTATPKVLETPTGLAAELVLTLKRPAGRTVTVDLLRTKDGAHSVPLRYDGQTLSLGKAKIALNAANAGDKSLTLHLIVDHSVIEARTADGSVWLTQVADYTIDGLGLAARAEGGDGAVVENLQWWPLADTWVTPEVAAGR